MKNFKSIFIQRRLAKMLLKSNRNVQVTNIADAKKIGIIYEATELEQFNFVKNFVAELHKIVPQVKSLGYVNKKQLEDFHLQPIEFSFFCNKDLNWYSQPTFFSVSDFIKEDFDILISLDTKEYVPIYYTLLMSEAKFKVGAYSEESVKYLDMMIDLSNDNCELSELVSQIIKYLKTIKTI